LGRQVSQEDVNKIFTALSHEIRREIIRILAEESPKTFSELMNKLDIRDTGTMVFHLRKLEGLITKNERGEYILTDLGRRAYQIMNQIKTERKEKVKEVSEKIIEKREAETISKTMIISDRLNLYIDKEFLENIRSSGRKLILRDIVNLAISDDIDPNLFNEIVEEISDVISIRAPKKLRPLIELKSRDVLTTEQASLFRAGYIL
jgi:DNA-binding HxlR family transcriptional regulator